MSVEGSLLSRYDALLLDLDGVVYVGKHAVPHAVTALNLALQDGARLAYVTNNAARTPQTVAAHLSSLGLVVSAEGVVTSAQAAARLVADQVPAGGSVFVIGGVGLEEALRERGLIPVTSPDADPVAVVQGFGPEMPWRQVISGAILVKQGLPWVASNADLTVPTPAGPGPGNGALVELVARFSDRTPVVAGKPEPPLFQESVARLSAQAPLVVGDRIDTDIDGAKAVGADSLLVMTGVSTIETLAVLEPERRPTYVGADLSVLHRPVVTPTTDRVSGSGSGSVVEAEVAGTVARIDAGRLTVAPAPGLDLDVHHWWQAVASALWTWQDLVGTSVDLRPVVPPR